MTSENRKQFIKSAGNAGVFIYYLIVLVFAYLIFTNLSQVSKSYQQQGEKQKIVAQERFRPSEDIIEYKGIYPGKDEYELGEPLSFKSDRFLYRFDEDDLRDFSSMEGLDIYYCNYYDGEGFGRTEYSFKRQQRSPTYGDFMSPLRTPEVGGKERPLDINIPARCKIYAVVDVCYRYVGENICKRDIIWSDEFRIE